MLIASLSFCFLFIRVKGLTCDEVRNTEGGAGSISEDNLSSLSSLEVETCLAELGKDRLRPEQGKILWKAFMKNYESINDIPNDKLRAIGWVSIGISVSEIRNLTLNNPEIIQAFGIYHALTKDQLSALAEQYFEYNNKEPEDMTYYDLIYLRQIICAFNKTEVERIHADEYKKAAGVLGTLKDCPQEILEALANLAMSEEAFGNPSSWSETEVKLLGSVIQGLSQEQRKLLTPVARQAMMS